MNDCEHEMRRQQKDEVNSQSREKRREEKQNEQNGNHEKFCFSSSSLFFPVRLNFFQFFMFVKLSHRGSRSLSLHCQEKHRSFVSLLAYVTSRSHSSATVKMRNRRRLQVTRKIFFLLFWWLQNFSFVSPGEFTPTTSCSIYLLSLSAQTETIASSCVRTWLACRRRVTWKIYMLIEWLCIHVQSKYLNF